MEGGVEPRAEVDVGRGVVELMVLAEVVEGHPSGDGGSRRNEADVKKVIGFRTDGGGQPISLIVDPHHRLVARGDLGATIVGPLVSVPHPLLDRGSLALGTECIK